MAAGIAEIFSDGSTRKRCIVLECSRIGSIGSHNDGVFHGVVFFKRIHYTGHSGAFLSDSYINTVNRITFVKISTLIDNRIDSNTRFAGLAVANDELALPASDRYHGVNGFQTGLKRLSHRLTVDYTRSFAFERQFGEFTGYLTASVECFPQRIDNAAKHSFAHEDGSHTFGAFHTVAFLDFARRT